MNVFELTRALIDIESITNNEERVGNFLYDYLAPIAATHGGRIERMEVEPRRFNVFGASHSFPYQARMPSRALSSATLNGSTLSGRNDSLLCS